MANSCPICCEPIDSLRQNSTRPCCKQSICHPCLYRHTITVFSEGVVGDGRKELNCPLGCGTSIQDGEVRSSIRHAHYSFRKHFVGEILLSVCAMMGFFWTGERWRLRRGLVNDVYFDYWIMLTMTEEEVRDIRQYERWSLTVAMSSRTEEQLSAEDAIYCPSPDCECMWVGSAPHRRKKQENEPKRMTRRERSSVTSRVINMASTWIFYQPPKPELVQSNWLDAEDVILFRVVDNRQKRIRSNDGRQLFCPKCNAEFCGLCRRPWMSFGGGKRLCHKGKTCASFSKKASKVGDDADGFAFTAQSVNARMCPGCSILTQRISGCNHMTCSCGMQWCYVCEIKWNVAHYSCVDRGGNDYNDSGDACVIL